jgi:abortive infection bacteriophage resistance protein
MTPLAPLLACAPRGVLFLPARQGVSLPDNTMKPKYTKPPLSLQAQAELLLSRRIEGIAKPDLMERLTQVSYYRWRGYTYPYQDNTLPESPFFPGTQWHWIESDYENDRALRVLIFDAIERIEVSLRTQLVLQVSIDHGSRWYMDPALFHDATEWARNKDDLMSDWNRSKEIFVDHHKKVYDDSDPPPSWKIFETSSLGTLSKFFDNMDAPLPCRSRIADFWGFSRHSAKVLARWFHHLNLVRNICAHHGRLYNRIIKVTPLFPSKPSGAWVRNWPDPNRVYASLCIIIKLLEYSSPEYKLVPRLKPLLARLRPAQFPSLGFPPDWESQPLFIKGLTP